MSDQVKKISEMILPILRQNGVLKAGIFGSYARNEAKADSDVDLLVDLKEEASLFDLIHLKQELEDVLNKKVDVVTHRAINSRLKPYIMKDIMYIYG